MRVKPTTGRKMQATIIRDHREELVDNPLTTYAQTLYESERGLLTPGKIKVIRNQRTLMGGFCRFGEHGRLPPDHLCEAAARLKSIHEQAQLGGARALDPAREAVDGGRGAFGSLDTGIDARQELSAVIRLLGHDYRKVEYVIIREHGPTAYARWRASIEGGSVWGDAVKRRRAEMCAIVERLAIYWRLA